MVVLKNKSGVYGAKLTAAEKKAMNIEIQRQLAEYVDKHELEIESLILWELHEQFGFGPKRLRQFYDNFSSGLNDLVRRYELESSDDVWLCTYKLREYGIDLAQWERERSDGVQMK